MNDTNDTNKSSNLHPFKVSIDDGFIEYTYILNVSDRNSIQSVWEKLRGSFGAGASAAVCRKSRIDGLDAKEVNERNLIGISKN